MFPTHNFGLHLGLVTTLSGQHATVQPVLYIKYIRELLDAGRSGASFWCYLALRHRQTAVALYHFRPVEGKNVATVLGWVKLEQGIQSSSDKPGFLGGGATGLWYLRVL